MQLDFHRTGMPKGFLNITNLEQWRANQALLQIGAGTRHPGRHHHRRCESLVEDFYNMTKVASRNGWFSWGRYQALTEQLQETLNWIQLAQKKEAWRVAVQIYVANITLIAPLLWSTCHRSSDFLGSQMLHKVPSCCTVQQRIPFPSTRNEGEPGISHHSSWSRAPCPRDSQT